MPTIAELTSPNAPATPGGSLFPIPSRTQPATQPAAQPQPAQAKCLASSVPSSADSPFAGAWMQGDSHWTRCVRRQRRPSWFARIVMDLFFDWNWVERQL